MRDSVSTQPPSPPPPSPACCVGLSWGCSGGCTPTAPSRVWAPPWGFLRLKRSVKRCQLTWHVGLGTWTTPRFWGHCRRLRSPTLPDRPPAPPAPPNLLDGTTWWSRTGASSRRARARGAGSRASHAAAAAAGAREPVLLPPRWPHRGPRVTLPAPDAGLLPARAWYFSGQANLPEDRNLPSHALQVPGHRATGIPSHAGGEHPWQAGWSHSRAWEPPGSP